MSTSFLLGWGPFLGLLDRLGAEEVVAGLEG